MAALPQYWCVYYDGTKRAGSIIKYINNTYGVNYGGCTGRYYGYDGSTGSKGTNFHSRSHHFKNETVVLTLDEFENSLKGNKDLISYEIC